MCRAVYKRAVLKQHLYQFDKDTTHEKRIKKRKSNAAHGNRETKSTTQQTNRKKRSHFFLVDSIARKTRNVVTQPRKRHLLLASVDQ